MKKGKQLTPGQQVKMCAEFNRKYPVYRVMGEEDTTFEAVTTTEAQMMGGHTAVVWLQGHGSYGLEFVKPLPVLAPEHAAVRG